MQDPYSFRCIPQVHGATKDTLDFVEKVILTEINSVTDNPNIFSEEDLIISGGNFHGQPLALALDYLKIAMAEIGNISERRIFQLVSGLRGLPAFLVDNPGLNSGFMIPQYTAASIVSANKQLASPASVSVSLRNILLALTLPSKIFLNTTFEYDLQSVLQNYLFKIIT